MHFRCENMNHIDHRFVCRILIVFLSIGLLTNSRAIMVLDTLNNDGYDVEEILPTGTIKLSDEYIELNRAGLDAQLVALRFSGVNIERGSTVSHAYIQFRTDANIGDAGSFSLNVAALDTANAPLIPATKFYLSQQNTTDPIPWNLNNGWRANTDTATIARTPDIAKVITKIVSRSGWAFGNSMEFVFSPNGGQTGYRAFPSYQKNPQKVPILIVNYFPDTNFSAIGSAVASSSVLASPPAFGIDGNVDTRWESNPAAGDSASWILDVGEAKTINEIYINWHTGALDYELLGSPDDSSWRVLAHITDGKPTECRTIQFPSSAAKLVKFHGIKRAGPGGYSFFEFEAYARPTAPSLITFAAPDTFVQTGLGTLRFTAVVNGIPVPKLVWYRINSATGAPDSMGVGFTFQLSNLSKADNGVYFPKATNKVGIAVGDSFRVVVVDPVVITSHPTPVSIIENSTATFSVAATGDNLTYQWFMIGGSTAGAAIPGAINPTLVLTAVPKSNDGSSYYCIVSNPVTKPPKQSTSAVLTVMPTPTMPTILFPATENIRATGSQVSLTATVSGSPSPQIVWYHINLSTGAFDSVGAGPTFQISNLTKANNGHYYPRATNMVGSVDGAICRLAVLDPVSIQTQPTNRSVAENQSATFSISASGDGLVFQWYRIAVGQTSAAVGTPVANANDSLLTISNVTRADSGTYYYCIVSNPVTVTTKRSGSGRLDLAKYYNPFHLKVARLNPHDTSQIAVTIWSEIKLAPEFYTPSIHAYADTIRIGYTTRSYPPTMADAGNRAFNIRVADIAATGKDTLTRIIKVESLPGGNDSSYYFAYSLLWHIPGSGDTLLMPLSNSARLFMKDTTAPVNTIGAIGAYYSKSDSVLITLSNAANLDSLAGSVRMQLSLERDYSIVFLDTVISAAVVKAAGASYRFVVKKSSFYGSLDTVFMRWAVVGKNSVSSLSADTSFTVGWSAPVFTGSLAATPIRSDWVGLSWTGTRDADSLKIWWSIDTVPSISSPDPSLYRAEIYDPSQTSDTLTGLSGSTRYFFAVQIFKDGVGSTISQGAKAYATTLAWDTTIKIDNRIVIDTSWFDTLKNTLHAEWMVDTNVTPENGSLEFGAVWSFNSTQRDVPRSWLPIQGYTSVTDIPLGSSILFDTTYYLAFWLRGVGISTGAGAPVMPAETGIDTIHVGSFTWQVVRYSPTDSVVYANNRKIHFKGLATSWCDTIKPYTPNPSLLDGMSVLSNGFVLTGNSDENVTIGAAYRNLPAGISERDVRLYRILGDSALIVERKSVAGSGVVSEKTHVLTYPFVVLADTVAPTVMLNTNETDTSQALIPGMPVIFAGAISDNVSNVIYRIQYARGNDGFVPGHSFTDTLSSDSGSFTTVINQTSLVSESCGLRVWLIVDDGVTCDTLDYSRQVQTFSSGEYNVKARKWTPVSVAVYLDTPVAHQAFFKAVGDGNTAGYDKSQFRLFRWGDSNAGHRSWLEYSDADSAKFSLQPASLFWLKTVEDKYFKFTNGKTPSLKSPVEVTLKAESWTDFALPFKFDITMRDLLAANIAIADSVQIYHWVQDSSTFVADAVYNNDFVDLAACADTFTMRYLPLCEAYTVYNSSSSAVTLKIPPLPIELSASMRAFSKPGRSNNNSWVAGLKWRPSEGGAVISRIRCGFNGQSGGKSVYYPLPPSFRQFGAGVVDSKSNIYGNVISHTLTDGGVAWEICLYNNDEIPQTIQFCLDTVSDVPPGMKPALLDMQKEAVAQPHVWQEVTLQPTQTEKRWIIVGNEGYLQRFKNSIRLGTLALMRLYPNPARQRIHIRYSIPQVGYRDITFAFYDLMGRMVWSCNLGKPTHAGVSQIVWNGTNARGTPAASGMYLLRMTAMDADGTSKIVGEQRVTFLP
jgi:hypothetical protein